MAVTSLQRSSQPLTGWFYNALFRMAHFFIDGRFQRGLMPSKVSLKVLRFAAHNGEVGAMSYLGRLLFQFGSCNIDKCHGIEYVREAAKKNDADAQFILGNAYLKGHAQLAQNSQEALHWLALASDNGHTQASQLLATLNQKP